MFPKNSAFNPPEEVIEHVEGVREQTLNTHYQSNRAERRAMEKSAAYDMLKAAENLIDDEEYAEAGELVRRAAELLNADTVSDS